ncbi:unnamed protein product, partial [Meganyctiphanes norvegica]
HRWWWGPHHISNDGLYVRTPNLRVRVYVYYKGISSRKVAYFDSLVYELKDSHMTLSIGNYTGGEAGNGWGAPFMGRRQIRIEKSNCKRFFLIPDEGCEGVGVSSYEEQLSQHISQLNATALLNNRTEDLITGLDQLDLIKFPTTRSYPWFSGDSFLDSQKINNIEIWITPKDSP